MFSLFRHIGRDQWDQLIEVDSWEQMIRVIEQYFDIIHGIDEREFGSCETAFRDENGDVYVVFRMSNMNWSDRYGEASDYDDYYDDIDRQTDNHYAQQRRELERWEYVFRDPDLLIKKYWPQPPLIVANRINEWYVGALHD